MGLVPISRGGGARRGQCVGIFVTNTVTNMEYLGVVFTFFYIGECRFT